jgi:predicted HTH domain antitoxin
METTLDHETEIHISVKPVLMQNQTLLEVQSKMEVALVVFEYLQGELSIGEVAEYYKKTVEETMEWLNSLGVASSRRKGEEVESILQKNMVEELKERGISYP